MKALLEKLVTFLIKKKVQSATGEITQTSKTKIFMTIEGVLLLVEFVTPYFGHFVDIPKSIHEILWTLAGLSYAERQLKPS